jgi:hypothetical protein
MQMRLIFAMYRRQATALAISPAPLISTVGETGAARRVRAEVGTAIFVARSTGRTDPH